MLAILMIRALFAAIKNQNKGCRTSSRNWFASGKAQAVIAPSGRQTGVSRSALSHSILNGGAYHPK